MYRYADSYGDTDADTHADPEAVAFKHGNAHGRALSIAKPCGHGDADRNPGPDTDGHCDDLADSHGISVSHADSDPNGGANGRRYGIADADSGGYGDAGGPPFLTSLPGLMLLVIWAVHGNYPPDADPPYGKP